MSIESFSTLRHLIIKKKSPTPVIKPGKRSPQAHRMGAC
jgi:hypothetical protein